MAAKSCESSDFSKTLEEEKEKWRESVRGIGGKCRAEERVDANKVKQNIESALQSMAIQAEHHLNVSNRVHKTPTVKRNPRAVIRRHIKK